MWWDLQSKHSQKGDFAPQEGKYWLLEGKNILDVAMVYGPLQDHGT